MKERFNYYKEFLLQLLPFAEVEHVGGSSIPGAITKNDLDIQIRIPSNYFESSKANLIENFKTKRENLWTKDFAIFVDEKDNIQVDIMLTTKDSSYDTFSKSRDLLVANKDGLLDSYNKLKIKHKNSTYEEIAAAKKEFFGKIRNIYLDIES